MYQWSIVLPHLALAAGVTVGAVFDLRARRVPNLLSLTLAIAGVAVAAWRPDMTILQSLAGFGVGLLIPFVLFALGMLGAGDAKLLAAIGAWVGPVGMLWILLLTGIAGGLLALALAIHQGRLLSLLRSTFAVGMSLLLTRRTNCITATEAARSSATRRTTVPYAVAILAGVLAMQSMLMLEVLRHN